MVQLVIFVNLFFVPALALYRIYQKKGKSLQLKLEVLFQYCIIAACNVPLTKVFIFLAKKTAGVFIPIDSGYYTLAALISAFLIYISYVNKDKCIMMLFTYCNRQYAYYKTYLKESSWGEKIGQRGVKRILSELVQAYLLVFASCFMMLIFEPILLYATNMNDFWFDFSIMIWPVLEGFTCFLLGGILIETFIYFVNLFISGRLIIFKGLNLAGFIVFFLLYLQGNWLAGNLPALTGDEIVWENYGASENLILMIALIFLIIAAVVGIRKLKLDRVIRYAATGAGIICVMLLVSLFPAVVENEALKSKDTFSPTLENFNAVSSNRNFLIFLVDSVDSKLFYDVMTNDADFDGILDDFTYYPDTTSNFLFTRDSIPNILTGSVNVNETNFLDYSSNAYNQSPLFEKLEQNGYTINLYSPDVIWSGYRNFKIANSASIYDIEVNLNAFMAQELRYILFKYLPYGFKQYSQIETLDFNQCRNDDSTRSGYSYKNLAVYSYIETSNSLDKKDENYFKFIHCEGGHVPFDMDKCLNTIDEGTYDQKVAASLTMIKTCLQWLKDNGAYDNSAIVIMADHGYYRSDVDIEPYKTLARCNPILFIKGINEKHEMVESDRPISYLDLQSAFCDLIDGKQSSELFAELQSGRSRAVMWDIITREYHMVEYETTGKAWEVEKFLPTGNVYDLEE